jgi:hypothetical protein
LAGALDASTFSALLFSGAVLLPAGLDAGADFSGTRTKGGQCTISCAVFTGVARRKLLKRVARPERVELPTFWFVARRSIQLSYGRTDQREQLGVTAKKLYHSSAGP